jgi:ectoine hydroxylase-related dioxygenase (phytanoyl-CoA dioxygenase family)
MSTKEANAARVGDGAYYKVLNQKVNTWRDHAGMARYTSHPRIARLAMELSGASGIRLFHDHALWKMPQDSKPTPWHQDFPYWPMNEPGALSVWIPMHDVDEHNGCMMFVPGSHKAGKLTGINFIEPQNIFDYVKGTELENRNPVIVPLKKGSCTFHHGLTFHYGHANLSDSPRRVLAAIYMPDGTTFNGKSHPCTNGLDFQENEPLHGGLFPVLARA